MSDCEAEATAPFLALDEQHEPLIAELRGAFERVVRSNAFILGHEVECFEQEFADFCGTSECVGVSSGTAALELTLRAAGIGPGDEVIVPAHTYIATALGVVHAGARPVFCDVEEHTGLIDVDSARARLTERTAAIIPVHLYGQICEMAAVAALAQRHGLLVLEDAAQAHGARYDGRRAGSLGRAAAFSFYPSKNLGALGDGGAICTSDPALAQRARRLRNLGQIRKGEHLVAGFNERLDGLQAALLRVKLPHLDDWNRRRRSLANVYRTALQEEVELLTETPRSPCVYHLFPIRTPDRDLLSEWLASRGISTAVHYSPAVHRQPPFTVEYADGASLPGAERWAREELSLPIYPELPPEEATRIAQACLDGVRQAVPARRVSTTEAIS